MSKNILTDLIINGTITANSIVKVGGTAVQFLKADGSIDTDVFQFYSDSPIKPIFWAGTQAEHDAKFGGAYVHPDTDFIIITDGASPTLTASDITFSPYLTITSVNTQAAIEELKDEVDLISGGGATQLSELSDVVSATNTNGFALIANGTTGYVGRAIVEADISDLQSYYLASNPSGYISGNQSITLSGDVTGTGTTVITTSISAGAVDIAMLSATGTPDTTTYLRGDNTWSTIAGSTAFSGTGTAINLSYTVGAYYNIGAASSATAFTTSSEVVGGFAIVMSRSTTTEPTVTATGTATKIPGATWVVDTDMYLNIYSYDGTNVFYYWTDSTSGISFSLAEDMSPQLSAELDAQANNIINLGDVTFQTGATGGTLRTGTSAADKFVLQGYDVDGTAYVKVLEVDSGNLVRLQLVADFLEIEDATDETKKLGVDLSGATTSTQTDLIFVQTANRSITFQDADGTVAYLSDVSGDDVSTFAEKTGSLVGTDRLVGLSGVTDFSETISGIPLSIFNNDSGWTSNVGDMVLGTTQTVTASKTFNSGTFSLRNPANTFSYNFLGSAIIADRNVTLPLLTGNDTFTMNAFAQTLTNKTIAFSSNTLTNVMSLTTAQSVTAGIKKTLQANATNAGLRLAGVTANPSTLVAGDLWYRSDTEKLSYQGTSAARSLVAENLTQTLTNKTISATSNTISNLQHSKSITIESPTSSEDISMWFSNRAITITQIVAVVRGTTPSVTWTIRKGSDRSAVGTEVVTGGTTTTSQTTGSNVVSFSSASVAANDFVWLETTAQSGTVVELNVTVIYTVN